MRIIIFLAEGSKKFAHGHRFDEELVKAVGLNPEAERIVVAEDETGESLQAWIRQNGLESGDRIIYAVAGNNYLASLFADFIARRREPRTPYLENFFAKIMNDLQGLSINQERARVPTAYVTFLRKKE